LKERPGFVFLRIKGLEVMGLLGNNEVGQSQIAKHEWFFSHKRIQLGKFGGVFFKNWAFGGLILLIEEETEDGSSNLSED